MKNYTRNNKGFTIIEVLIVLAIAGLILLVVFLAVPALQRNARNTQRKSDVSSVLGAVGEYVANNTGALPTAGGNFATQFAGAAPKLGFYTAVTQVTYNYSATVRGALPAAATGNDTVVVYNYLKCDPLTPSIPTLVGASARSVAAIYNVEGSGGDTKQCQES